MFSTLSSYIWASRPEDQTVPDGSVEVREKLAESEWILVDVVKPSTSAVKSGMTGRIQISVLLYKPIILVNLM